MYVIARSYSLRLPLLHLTGAPSVFPPLFTSLITLCQDTEALADLHLFPNADTDTSFGLQLARNLILSPASLLPGSPASSAVVPAGPKRKPHLAHYYTLSYLNRTTLLYVPALSYSPRSFLSYTRHGSAVLYGRAS